MYIAVLKQRNMDINKAMQKCFLNGIVIYPEYCDLSKKFKIHLKEKDKKPFVYGKEITQNEINEALEKTYIYNANKL